MSYSIFAQLGIDEVSTSTLTIQLVYHSITYKMGKIEDVLVKVDKFVFPMNFIILDYKIDRDVPIILGRPFLATGRTLIDIHKEELTMRSTTNRSRLTSSMHLNSQAIWEIVPSQKKLGDYSFLEEIDFLVSDMQEILIKDSQEDFSKEDDEVEIMETDAAMSVAVETKIEEEISIPI